MSDSEGEEGSQELVNMATPVRNRRGSCCGRHPVACGVTLLVVAALSVAVVATAAGLRSYLNEKFRETVEKQAELVPGSEGTSQFEQSSAPLYSKFYFFSVTNKDDVINNEAHPVVTQLGPYTYREWRIKGNLSWNGNQTIVHYDLNTTYTFEPTMSSGDPKKDRIVTLNIPYYVLLLKAKELEKSIHDWEKALLKIILDGLKLFSGEKGLFTTLLVEDLLFGYDDPLLSFVKKYVAMFSEEDAKKINPFFQLENVTEIERDNAVYTGKHDISKIGQFIEWNGNFKIFEHGGWGTETAKMINGTGGFLFHPNVERDHNLTAFISELFRSGYFSYMEDKKLFDITVYRFGLPKEELVSANQDPGFHANGPNGLLNLTAVFEENAPVFASKPHFLDADPGYRANVTGMQSNRSLHDSYLDVEPITGAVIRAAKRIQINLQLHRYEYFSDIKKIMPQLMMPVFWASEEGCLTESDANEFKKKVYGAKYGMEAAVWGGVGLGGLVFVTVSLCFIGLVVQQCRSRRKQAAPPGSLEERTSLLN